LKARRSRAFKNLSGFQVSALRCIGVLRWSNLC